MDPPDAGTAVVLAIRLAAARINVVDFILANDVVTQELYLHE
jgi:hypothetical protein